MSVFTARSSRKRRPSRLRSAALSKVTMALVRAVAGLLERNPDRPDGEAGPPRGQPTRSQASLLVAADAGRGRWAKSPEDIPARGWKDILWRTYEQINDDRVLATAAGVTYYALLALFPAIAAFVAIYGLFADPQTIQQHFDEAKSIMPYGAADVIGEQLKSATSKDPSTLGFTTAIGILVSLWSANSGMKAIFDALNVAYNEKEKRSFFWLNAQSLLFTLGGFVFLALTLAAIVAVPIILHVLPLGPLAGWAVTIAPWVVMLGLIVFALAVLYRYGPSRTEPQWRWVTPGSLLASVVWLIASAGLSFYASHFANYDKTYGSLGAVIGFMIWMWVSAIIILVGAEMNSEIEHQTVRDSTEKEGAPIGTRGATMADTVGKAKT